MRGNTIHIVMAQGKVRKSLPLWQYDYGQILILDGLELPSAYEVHFAADESGNSVTQIGGENGVSIPDSLLEIGNPIHVWLFIHTGENDGETEVHGVIPVIRRAKPTNATPTPVQQDAITEAIAALNAAVDEAEGIAEAIPGTVNDALAEAKASGEFDGADGVSPAVTITSITGGYRITIVDADGTHTADVMDGEDGQDGTSPTVTVTDITGGHRLTITDANGSRTVDVMDGQDGQDGQDGDPGQDGFSPTATVTKSGKVATISITDKNGTTSETVSDGEDADPTMLIDDTAGSGDTGKTWSANKLAGDVMSALNDLTDSIAPVETTATATAAHAVGELFMMGEMLMVALSAIAVGDTITTTGNSPNAAVTTLSSKLIKDVQIDGASILSNGVANIPIGSYTQKGVYRLGQGLKVYDSYIMTNPPNDATIKAGTDYYAPIVPVNQHKSVFYGLAKAAGNSDQSSSSNSVGTYTEDAKVKIQKMLGLYKAPYRKIKEITITEPTLKFYVTTDEDGEEFALSDVLVFFNDVVSDNVGNAVISVNSGNTISGDIPKVYAKGATNTTAQTKTIQMWVDGGKFFSTYTPTSMAQSYSQSALEISRAGYGVYDCGLIYEMCIQSANNYNFTGGKIIIYGR